MKISQVIAFCSLLLLQQASAASIKGVKQTPNGLRRQLKSGSKKKKGPSKRACKYSEKDEEVKFSCKSVEPDESELQSRGITLTPDDLIKDKISYKVSTKKEGVKVKVEYKEEYLDDETDEWDDEYEEVKTTFEVNFDSIIEYSKGDSEGEQAYDWESDSIIQTLTLEDWNEFSTVMSDEEGVVSFFNTSTVDGKVAFNFTINRANAGDKASANSMKIDVNIVDFPWVRDDTYIALMSTVKSKLKVYMEYDDEAAVEEGPKGRPTQEVQVAFDQAISEIGASPYGDYTWENFAEATQVENATNITLTADDNPTGDIVQVARQGAGENATESEEIRKDSIRVVATSPERLGNETYQLIAYSFVGEAAQGASDIYWDPETGVGYSAASGVGFAFSVVGSLLVSGMLLMSS